MDSSHLQKVLSACFLGVDFEPYFAFIESLPQVDEGHRHHILPKKEFPEFAKDPSNLVRVSPANHFRAHYHLAVCAPDCESFQFVFYLMANRKRVYQVSDSELTHYAEVYERGKIKQAEAARERGLKFKESGHIARLIAARHAKPDSEETRKRMGDAHRGEKNHNYGKTPSVETRRKLSEARKGKMVGVDNPMFGRKRPDLVEWKRNHSLAGVNNPMFGKTRPDLAEWNRQNLKGKPHAPFSEEHKKNISEAKWGKLRAPFSDEHKKNLSKASRQLWADKTPEERNNYAKQLWVKRRANGDGICLDANVQ